MSTLHSPAPASRAGSGPSRVLSREQVLAVIRDEPNASIALSVARAAVAQQPGDELVRLLFAGRLARIGLRTLAVAELEAVSPGGPLAAQADAMRQAVGALPDDAVSRERLLSLAKPAIDRLASEGVLDGEAAFNAFSGVVGRRTWWRTLEGALAWREGPSLEGCDKSHAPFREACLKLVDASREFTRPLAVCGRTAAVTASFSLRATSTPKLGHTPRIFLIEPDVVALCEGLAELALADPTGLEALLASPRVAWHVGPGALDRLATDLDAKVAALLPDRLVASPGSNAALSGAVTRTLEAAHAHQKRTLAALHAQVESLYAMRTQEWWSRRFEQARAMGEPLRVMVITSRFTTYVQHAARDLAGAFERAGHRVEILMEGDDHSTFSACAHLGLIARFEPDVVLCINYPRAVIAQACPANVPYVCWIQDALSHLFDESVGRATTRLDFLVGHLFNELFEKFGFPVSQGLPCPVVADAVKFHPGPVVEPLRSRFACDVAVVSHQSETPEAMHRRLVADATANAPLLAAAFERLRPAVEDVVDRCAVMPANKLLSQACASVLRTLGDDDERNRSLALRGYALPMADRLLRHRMIAAAADVCERHGLSMHLHGKGWESHPTLSHLAAGPLSHDEELRAAYAGAKAHLHVSINTFMHQRVLECFLSGGLCLCMRHREALAGVKTAAQLRLLPHQPDRVDEARGLVGYSCERHPEAAALARTLVEMGEPPADGVVWLTPARLASMRRLAPILERQVGLEAILPDVESISFTDAPSLERRILMLTSDGARRARIIEEASANIRRRFTHDALAASMLDFITDTLHRSQESST